MTRKGQRRAELERRRLLQAMGVGLGALALGGLGACKRGADAAGAAEGAGGAQAAGGAAAGGKPFAGQTLRVFVYAGAWEKGFREAFVPRFEQATGAKVVVDPGWWDSIPKLKASPKGQPAFDLVLTDATQGYPAIREGLFAQLDMARLPQVRNVAASALDSWVVRERYGVTFPESVMTLGYHRELVPFEPTGWGDLMREEVRGKLGLYNSFYMSLFTFAAMKAAADGKPGTAAQLMAADLPGVMAFAREQRGRVKYWWPTSTDMALNLGQRNCALGNMHSSDMLVALRSRKELAAVVPAADRAFVQLMWVVPSDTPRKDLAHAAIDTLFSEPVQEGFARGGNGTALPAVARRVAAADPAWAAVYPSSEEELARVAYYPYDAYAKDWDAITAQWDAQVLRKA
jgi:spermidine/putrescine-binding protein